MGFQITGVAEADEVLDRYPIAILIGMMLDQQYGMEHAFRGAYKVLTRFDSLDPAAIAAAPEDEFTALCSQAPAIHRFPGSMSVRLQDLCRHLVDVYEGDPTRLWGEAATGAELFRRIKALPGFGEQKARIFVAFLAKRCGVRPEGWEAVAGDYALDGFRSVADVADAESMLKVREFKKAKKAGNVS